MDGYVSAYFPITPLPLFGTSKDTFVQCQAHNLCLADANRERGDLRSHGAKLSGTSSSFLIYTPNLGSASDDYALLDSMRGYFSTGCLSCNTGAE